MYFWNPFIREIEKIIQPKQIECIWIVQGMFLLLKWSRLISSQICVTQFSWRESSLTSSEVFSKHKPIKPIKRKSISLHRFVHEQKFMKAMASFQFIVSFQWVFMNREIYFK